MLDDAGMQVLPELGGLEDASLLQVRTVNLLYARPPHELGRCEALNECTNGGSEYNAHATVFRVLTSAARVL